MESSTNPIQKMTAGFKRFLAMIKAGWVALIGNVNEFIKAPFTWTWTAISKLYRWVARTLRRLIMLPVQTIRSVIRWAGKLTARRLWAVVWRVAVWGGVFIGAGLFAVIHWPNSQVPEVEAADPIVYLDQGWGSGRESAYRQIYYYTPQGTGNVFKQMRYSWFVNLELPWGKKRLADPDNMLAYGFQVDAEPTKANPYKLPVGFTRHFDTTLGEDVLDVSCAACHTGNLLVRKDDGSRVSIRIDGGQAMHAFTAATPPHVIPVMLASMASTLLNPIKFNRFALRVLGAEYYKEGKSALREEFSKTFWALIDMGANEKKYHLSPVEEGPARTDALGRIANMVFGDHITPENYQAGNAPVNYPPVWDIWKFDWVQYSGSVAQPMARNLGESLGVGATYDFFDTYQRPLSPELRYSTTTRLIDLHSIEETLRKLRPPVWLEDVLGEIDMDKAASGGIHFIRTCQGCHGPHPASHRQKTLEAPLKTAQDPHWKMKLLPAYEIGTDATAAVNFVRNRYDLTRTGARIEKVRELVGNEWEQYYQRVLKYDFKDDNDYCAAAKPSPEDRCADWNAARAKYDGEIVAQQDAVNLSSTSMGQGLNYFGMYMSDMLYAKAGFKQDQIAIFDGFGALDLPQVKMVYKARPLAGAWATAPYLHNGSVRNIYQLLSPQYERDRKFFIGRPEYDPVQLGLAVASSKTGGFWLDTSIKGNANTGHEFRNGYTEWKKGNPPQFGVIGPEYTSEERYEIIEYLKVHLDDPPHSGLYTRAFKKIVATVAASMPDEGDELKIADTWPLGQACNLQEYMNNHVCETGQDNTVAGHVCNDSYANGLDDTAIQQIEMINKRLDAYFQNPNSYLCGGKTRYQRGGEKYEQD